MAPNSGCTYAVPANFSNNPNAGQSGISSYVVYSPPVEKKNPLKPKRVIYNDPATIIVWEDGTKTVVKCGSDCVYSEYGGFCAATTKKVFGSNNAIRRAAGLPKEKRKKPEEIKSEEIGGEQLEALQNKETIV